MVRPLIFWLLASIAFAAPKADPTGWNLYPRYGRRLCHMATSLKKQLFFRAKTSEKRVALTFDDGPLRRTPALLKLLRSRHVPATFFLLAPQLNTPRAHRYEGTLFSVGLHGYHHVDFRKLTPAQVRRELDRALKIFHRYGLHPRYFRPPYGMVSATLLQYLAQHQLRTILWSIDSQDWNHYHGTRLIENIRKSLAPGSIILLHDQATSLADVAALIDAIQTSGYRIVPLGDLVTRGTLLPCPK